VGDKKPADRWRPRRAWKTSVSKHTSVNSEGQLDGNRRFATLPLEILRDRRIGAAAKLVWMALNDRVGQNGQAWPSSTQLGKDVGLSARTVKRAVLELLKRDPPLLEKVPRGPGRSNAYRVLNPGQIDPGQNDPGQDGTRTRDKLSLNPGQIGPQNQLKEPAKGNHTQKKRARSAKAKAAADPWSEACRHMAGDALKTDAFRRAWMDWLRYRKERRSPLTSLSIKRQIRRLEQFGHDGAIAAIEQSITNGWQGLFPPRPAGSGGNARSGAYRPAATQTSYAHLERQY